MKQVFGEFGIPSKVVSDNNGPHYDSDIYRQFAKEWGFEISTSSPRYPKSNGFIESQVDIAKKTIVKAMEKSGEDPQLALLTHRATPIDNKLPSLAELLLGRRLSLQIPTKIVNMRNDKDNLNEHFQEKQEQMKMYHDRSVQPLQIGQSVCFQKEKNAEWLPANIVDTAPEPRSYILKTPNGRTLRRNSPY
jgi:hypothetical protein